MFLAFFDARSKKERRADRHPATLDATDRREFILERRAGKIGTWGPVKDRQIEYDLKYMLAVLAWAAGAEDGKPQHIAKHPWSRERRRAQKMGMTYEKNPTRESVTEKRHALLPTHSPNWQYTGVMELCRETLHRRDSVRRLAWEDVRLARGEVLWRAESDKNGIEVVTPLSARAVEVLRGLPRSIGSPWVFPAETDPSQPVPLDTLNTWMRRAKKRAGLGDV